MSRRQPRDSQSHCDTCGWNSKTTTAGLAAHALALHSCARTIRLAAAKRRGEELQARIDRTPKPCHHKHAQHKHGVYSTYVLDHCRCWPCVKAATAWKRNQVRKAAQGRWQPYVDASQTRQHIERLQQAGMGAKRVAEAAGISPSVVCSLLYGKGGRRPSQQIRPATAEALLAVTLDLAPSTLIDATGTWRRLEALVAIGWAKAHLAHRLGLTGPGLQIRRVHVEVATAEKVKRLYDDLANTPGSSARARNDAKRAGYLHPGWWDPDTIDDPTYTPATHVEQLHWSDVDEVAVDLACAGRAVGRKLTRAEKVTAVLRLSDQGLDLGQIADRTGIHRDQAGRYLRDFAEQVA